MTEPTKSCPECGETILAVARRCKHCHADLSGSSTKPPGDRANSDAAPQPAGTYTNVPWFRRNWFAILCGLFFTPALLPVLLTGTVYYIRRGELRPYSTGARIVLLAWCALTTAYSAQTIYTLATGRASSDDVSVRTEAQPAAPAPTAEGHSVAAAPTIGSDQARFLQYLEGRWSLPTPIGNDVVELHYARGRVLMRKTEASLFGPQPEVTLSIIEPAGSFDAENSQLPIKLTRTADASDCHAPQHMDLAEDSERKLSAGCFDMHQCADSVGVVGLKQMLGALTRERAKLTGDAPDVPEPDSGTLKNVAADPDHVQPAFVADDGTARELSFIRKLTPAEALDIEHLEQTRAANANALIEQCKTKTYVAKTQKFDELIAEVNRRLIQDGEPANQSASATPASGVTTEPAAGSSETASSQTAPHTDVAPSFDCSKASSGVEKMICTDPALAVADASLAASYAKAKASGMDPVGLRNGQRAFLQARNGCNDSACVASAYRVRAAELGTPQ